MFSPDLGDMDGIGGTIQCVEIYLCRPLACYISAGAEKEEDVFRIVAL
jgi:hypothetical protein